MIVFHGNFRAIDTKVQSNYFNESSALTSLSQIGIDFQRKSAGAGALNINLNTLGSAFKKDAAGTVSLLSQVEDALVDLAGGYVTLAGKKLPALPMLALAQYAILNHP